MDTSAALAVVSMMMRAFSLAVVKRSSAAGSCMANAERDKKGTGEQKKPRFAQPREALPTRTFRK